MLIYALISAVFIIIGVAVGVNMTDKAAYLTKNGAPIFMFLRGDIGVVSFFFFDLFSLAVYCIFSLSVFFHRIASFLSLAPCMYRSYSAGVQTCVILTVFSASSIPMLFVFFVPATIIEIVIVCVLSHRCLGFAAFNSGALPTAADIREYYRRALPQFFAAAVCVLIKTVTIALFGSALIGVI